ncbi:MAG TPA: transcription termination/antitermination NusG family protein [bacterium]|nr:transcription termination/antitermination NusG family protein [bacterium]HPN29724.1 transcription termination/antitermination NusG family protein [bacterium]
MEINLVDNYYWYVLNVITGKEELIKFCIEEDFKDELIVKLPKKKMLERRKHEYKETLKILFPGYMFILIEKIKNVDSIIDNIEMLRLKNIGLIKILRDSETLKPIFLERKEIEKVMTWLNKEDFVDYTVGMKVGNEVKLIAGPFKDEISKIVKINWRKFRISVQLNFLGQQTVDFPFTYIEPLS